MHNASCDHNPERMGLLRLPALLVLAAVLAALHVQSTFALGLCTALEIQQRNCAALPISDTCMRWVCVASPALPPGRRPTTCQLAAVARVGAPCHEDDVCIKSGTCNANGACIGAAVMCKRTGVDSQDPGACICNNNNCIFSPSLGQTLTPTASIPFCVPATSSPGNMRRRPGVLRPRLP